MAMRWWAWISSQPAWLWPLSAAVVGLHIYEFDVTWFSIDQARDVLQASDIAGGRNLPLNGPEMHWIAHIGPLYWYVLAVPFLFTAHPYAAYYLLALQATGTVLCGYYFLQRYFRGHSGWLFVVLYAPSTFVLLDSRALWTPAFLPMWNMLAMWAMAKCFWEGRESWLVFLAAVLGAAVQFHLTFALVLIPTLVGMGLYRPRVRLRTVVVGVAIGLLTHAPYLYFQATHDWVDVRAFLAFAGGGAGAAPLGLTQTVFNCLIIPAQLGREWLQLRGLWLRAFAASAYLFSLLTVLSLVWIFLEATWRWKRERVKCSRRLFVLLWFVLVLTALLNRSADLYYYYFDVLLPLPFLLSAVFLSDVAERLSDGALGRGGRIIGAACLAAYVVVQVGALFDWTGRTAESGLYRLTVDQLDVYKFQTAVGRREHELVPMRHKAQLGFWLAQEKGWGRMESYEKVLGSRFYDATEERGFWIGYYRPPGTGRAAEEPVVLWHRSDTLERWAESLGISVERVGPFRFGRLETENSPGLWQLADGSRVRMPARTIPELREYGFVPERAWPPGPVRLSSLLLLKDRPHRYLLVVITKGGMPFPQLRVNGQACMAIETGETLMTHESYFTLESVLQPGVNQLELLLEGQGNFDLEVFGWAKWQPSGSEAGIEADADWLSLATPTACPQRPMSTTGGGET